MSSTKSHPQARAQRLDRVRAPSACAGVLLSAACLVLGLGCGEDERARMLPPTWPDGAVVRADSGVPDPALVPPPVVVPPVMDAGAEAGTTGPSLSTGARPDASVADAAGPAAAMDAAPGSTDASSAGDGSVAVEGGAAGDAGNANPCGTGPEPLAANIRVTEVSLYQTVKIPLYRNNAWVTTRNAPVVQGKKSLVRVFVAPQTGYTPHELRGVLSLDSDGTKTQLISSRTISAASTDDKLESTFEFQVEGALLKGATQISVAVLENSCMPAAANSAARVPASGGQALNADAIGKLSVVLVPLTMGGRTPDVSQAQIDKIKAAFVAFYPVSTVEVSAHAPVSTNLTARADGGGWSEILNLVGTTRQRDAPAANVYYFGMMNPAASFMTYCRTGCVLGLAPLATRVSRTTQIGLGVGFVDDETITTIVHELGHAHGLPHAPCSRGGGIEGADQSFPYAGAKIGVWGWDYRSNKLMSPATYVDMMSYCTPEWISDYNYAKLATRSKAVNTVAFVFGGDQAPSWHGILLGMDGSARWSGLTSDVLPGEPSKARVLDAHGSLVTTIEVARVSLSNTADSYLYIPQPEARWAAIDLGDRVINLAAVGAAGP